MTARRDNDLWSRAAAVGIWERQALKNRAGKIYKRIFALLCAVWALCVCASCGAGTPVPESELKKGIMQIPGSEEELRAAAASLRRTENSYLPERTEEQLGSYLAEDCAILVRRITYSSGRDQVTAYAADVYIDDMSQFLGYVCRTKSGSLGNTPADEVIKETNAPLLINADYLSARKWGLYVRAGVKIRDKGTEGVDVCLIGKDGVMRVENGDTFDYSAEKKSGNVYHIFSFGPSLLNGDGSPRDKDSEFHITDKYSKWNNYESSVGFPVPNPRTAVGQASDGHFIFVTVDGRMKGFSRGATFPELSHIVYEEGATVAYNMDGGGSEIMCFLGEELTKQYSEDAKRIPSDYICILSEAYAFGKEQTGQENH